MKRNDIDTSAQAAPAAVGREASGWINGANLASARVNRERGSDGDTHTWSEVKTNYHTIPVFTALATPAAEVAPTAVVTLTARELRNALDFVAPDFDTDEDQRDTNVTIGWAADGVTKDDEGNGAPAGWRAWYSDHPEEGCIQLLDEYAAAPECAETLATDQAAVPRMDAALRIALEDLDAMEAVGPTTEAVIAAAQRWYLAAAPKASEPEQRELPDLWAIHVPGPDDLIAAPSNELAVASAAAHNATFRPIYEAQLAKSPGPHWPPIESTLARVVPWPDDAASHAEAVQEWAASDWAANVAVAPERAETQSGGAA